ncbi:MAG: hypothetical protein AAGI54_04440 [Planctomycetota bacterium]
MDLLDESMDAAFWRVWGQFVRSDAVLGRRLARRRGKMLSERVPRALCVGLRAGDTRLDALAAVEDVPRGERGLAADLDRRLAASDGTQRRPGAAANAELSERRVLRAQRVWIDGPILRRLTEPVRIPWPGVTVVEAAGLLGYHPEAMRGWLRSGGRGKGGRQRDGEAAAWRRHAGLCEDDAGEVDGAQPGPATASPFVVRTERRAVTAKDPHHGGDWHGGLRAVAMVWSRRPIEPAWPRGRGADAWWGTRGMADVGSQISDAGTDRTEEATGSRRGPGFWSQVVLREAIHIGDRGQWRWVWRCPGCGTRCKVLFWPTGCGPYLRHWDEQIGLAMRTRVANGEMSAATAARWSAARSACFDGEHPDGPGLMKGWRAEGLACGACHGVTAYRAGQRGAWNAMVTAMSGGLLTGREVSEPMHAR